MSCKCIEQVNEQLAEHNSALDLAQTMDFGPPLRIRVHLQIATRKIHPSRKPAKAVLASFCPFCGKSTQDKPKPAARKKAAGK